MSTAGGDWGGWTPTAHTLLYWGKWLADKLAHSDKGAWPAVIMRFYATADPLATAVAVALLCAAFCFVASLPTNNHSFVDKLWSIVPVYYVWHFALHDRLTAAAAPLSPRLALMGSLAVVWGTRLTANFARKGGYAWSAEDYRWPYVRARLHPAAFLVFNLLFIALYQHLLLLSLATPAYLAWQNAGAPLNALDGLAAALCTFFILYEAAADQQQWVFQTAKHARLAAGKRLTGEFRRGFLTSGLWRYSRHPNFWAEQSLWLSFYLFGVAASGRWLNWTLVAPLQLIALFQGSTWLTESISAGKYPAYRQYQATTSCFIPWFPAQAPDTSAPPDTPSANPPARSTRRSSRVAASAQGAPATPATADVAEEEGAAAAATPTTAGKRRTRARAVKGDVAVADGDEEEAAAAQTAASRPSRSPRKTARALAAEPVPARQSTRLRAKTA